MWSHPDSREPVTKDQYNTIKMGDNERSKSQTIMFMYYQTSVFKLAGFSL
jgi:hypothetical protein